MFLIDNDLYICLLDSKLGGLLADYFFVYMNSMGGNGNLGNTGGSFGPNGGNPNPGPGPDTGSMVVGMGGRRDNESIGE